MKAKVIPIKSRLFKVNKITKKRQRLSDNNFRDLSYMVRANDRTKYVSEKAQKVATNLHKILQKAVGKKTFINHNFLSDMTRVRTSDQNANIMAQLDDVFIREYHSAIYFDGEIKRWGYIVKYTEDGEERMNNPSKFYKMDSRFKPDTNSDTTQNKLGVISKKIRTHSIYKEIIEDIPQGYISSIIEESTTQESVSSPPVITNETSSIAALPTLRGSSNDEFLAQPLKSGESALIDPTKLVKPRIVVTAAMQQELSATHNIPDGEPLTWLAVRRESMKEIDTISPIGQEKVPRTDTAQPQNQLLTAKQERERYNNHRDRPQGDSSESKAIGATILSLVPKLIQEAPLEIEEPEFKPEEKPYDLDEEFRQVLAEKAERAAIWQSLLSRITERMDEIPDPLSGKMREVTLEDMRVQFGNMNFIVDLEAKTIKLQAKSELWIPVFELIYAAKFKDAAIELGYGFELVRNLGGKS